MGKSTKVLFTGKSKKDYHEKLNLFIDVEDYDSLNKEAIKKLTGIIDDIEEIGDDNSIPPEIKTALGIAISRYL